MRPLPLSRGRLALAAAVVAGLAVAAIVALRPEPVVAPGPVPEPIAPFGLVRAPDLMFRWALPADGGPVAVEVLDPGGRPVWRSPAVESGRLRPERSAVAAWPAGDLYWRPVAGDGQGRVAGDLAAFTLVR